MRARIRGVGALVLLALIAAACATTPLGKATEAANIQKQVVELSAVELVRLHDQGKVSDVVFAKGKDAYGKWAVGEVALAKSLADWKRLGDADSSQRLSVALQQSGALLRVYTDLVGQFVDLSKIKASLGGK